MRHIACVARRLGAAALAGPVALYVLAHLAVQRLPPPAMENADTSKHQAMPDGPGSGPGPGSREAPPPEEGMTSGGLDAGTEMAELLKGAQPMPTGGLPRQQSAPCPGGIEEINGYCWKRWPLTSEQVKAGVCDEPDLYEPSAGWCRAHLAGFRPFYGSRRTNNAVDP